MATDLEGLKVLKTAEQIAEEIWSAVSKWKAFEKSMVGEQLARAADSIGANIAEVYGRFHYGDKLKFPFYARGSVYETKYWINRAHHRKLLDQEKSVKLINALTIIARQINSFSGSINEQRKHHQQVKEERGNYQVDGISDSDALVFTEEDVHTISNL